MASVLMIVARDRAELYDRLCQEFHADHGVSVVLDRRFEERRRRAHAITAEQRRADRRQRHVDDQLRGLGWVTVRAS